MNEKWKTIGFESAKNNFSSLIEKDELAHAYLFAGQDMIGKRTFAIELASKLSDASDIFLLDKDHRYIEKSEPTENILLSEIKLMKHFIATSPAGKYKTVIIDNAHNLVPEANHSILKVMEEPSAKVIFILVTSLPSAMLPTILSRCQLINFNPHSAEIIKKYLQNAGLNREQIDFLDKFANGRIGLAIELNENKEFSTIKTAIQGLQKVVNAPIHVRIKTAEQLASGQSGQVLRTLLYWILYLRSPLSAKMQIQKARVLRVIMDLYHSIGYPSFNKRLLIESALTKL